MSHKFASNNQLKMLKKLMMRKYRNKEGLFVAEGVRCVEQILDNGQINLKEVFADESLSDSFSFIPAGTPTYFTDGGTLSDISDTENTQGILAICEIPKEKQPDEIAVEQGLIVALDAIQDPGNAGTIIRTATWFGASAILSGTGTVDIYHPKVVRSTAGATGCLPVLSGNLQNILPIFDASGWSISLLDGGANAKNIKEIAEHKRQLIVVGNEGNGVQQSVLKLGYPTVTIPGDANIVESLNAAVACSIALFHFSAPSNIKA
jgi:TrmH family RNA methyltransferase